MLTPGRAGSVALLSMLNSHPEVACDFEVLKRRVDDPVGELEALAGRALRSGAQVWGCSVHPEHFVVQGIASPGDWVAARHDEGTRLVTLARRNPVHHALSALIAEARGQWHAEQGPDARPIRLDPWHVLRGIHHAEWSALEVQRLVGTRSHLALVYEDDLQGPEAQPATAARVCRFLGVEPMELRGEIQRRRTPLRQQIENLDQIRAVLATTPYGHHLEEET